MEFLSIPVEVIDSGVLPYLDWNDLLRFRRVCKATKAIVHGYINVHPELAPEIEINEDDKTFGAFLNLNIPTTRIFLDNPFGDEFYEEAGEESVKFLELYGPLIKQLRVQQAARHMYGKEWRFLEALVNLESFEAKCFGYGKPVRPMEMHEVINEKYRHACLDPLVVKDGGFNILPDVFNQLKTVKIGKNDQEEFRRFCIFKFTCRFLTSTDMIENISLPFNTSKCFDINMPEFRGQPLSYAFNAFVGLIQLPISLDGKPLLSNLKVIDFACYHGDPDYVRARMEWSSSSLFIKLCAVCVTLGIKLLNVAPYWLHSWNAAEHHEIGKPILSLVNVHPCILPLHIPNLERIEIPATSQCDLGGNWMEERPDWPSLKVLDVTVDSRQGVCVDWSPQLRGVVRRMGETRSLFQFFFQNVSRTALTDLRLNFTKDAGNVAIPRIEDVVSSCPNLKRLTIINWPGTNKALTKLWSDLPGLEEVSLECCKNLGNVAFVGEDVQSPVFLKLAKLKKMTLKGLEKMPKITDTVFSLVIRHLKLTHLVMTSDDPVQTVTVAGVRSLLEGPFAGSIERFSFGDWSLENVSAEEFRQLEKEFRSCNML